MTREEKLYSMTMKALILEAEKIGVKIDKKGSKQKAVEKMLAAENALTKVEEKEEVVEIPSTEKEVMIDGIQEPEPVEVEEPKQKKERKEKKEKVNTFTLVSDVLASLEGVTFTITPQGKGMSVKKDGKKVVELWKRAERVRMYIGEDNLEKINSDLLENITDNPGMKKYNKSVYIPMANIEKVLKSIL